MPAYPDEQTIRIHAVDRRTPAQRVALARRELARRPRATLADVRLSGPDRAVRMFGELYPAVAESFHPAALWSAAHGPAQPAAKPTRRPCGWCLARAWSRRYGGRALRVDQQARLLIGDPCPTCAQALGWQPPAKPKPKAKPRPAGRSRATAARSSTASSAAAKSSTTARSRWPAPAELAAATRASLTAAAAPQLDPATAAYNRQAIARLGLGNPDRWPHLTRAGRR